MEESHWTSYYDNVTTLHPLALFAIVLMVVAVFLVKREHILIPIIVITSFIPVSQRIVVFNFDFTIMRLAAFSGIVRVIFHREYIGFNWNPLDKVLILFVIVRALIYILLWRSTSALVNQLGGAFETLSLYFLFRFLIRKKKDLDIVIQTFILISIPVAVTFIIELKTQNNVYSLFGIMADITRGGKIRCKGAFPQPIIAGSFWASLLPLFITRMWDNKTRTFGVIGIISSVLIVITTFSSGPLMGLTACLIGYIFFPLRKRMRLIRLSVIAMILALHLYMQAPVWYILTRIPVLGGSHGYHRAFLIDSAVRHFKEWWLLGTKSTDHWGWMMWDITNTYIAVAVRGGLVSLIIFILVIISAYKNVAKLIQYSEKSRRDLIFMWSIGVALFVHLVQFIGTSYFGQVVLLWYFILAVSASLLNEYRIAADKP
jgi:hypothetical protein